MLSKVHVKKVLHEKGNRTFIVKKNCMHHIKTKAFIRKQPSSLLKTY